jgi:nicotinate phosphoribosyltransferase
MRAGKRVAPAPTLAQTRDYALGELRKLPERLASLDKADPVYRVDISPAVKALAEEVDQLERSVL